MDDWKEGDRVGAILSIENGQIKFLGYGIYVGKEIPPPGIKFLGMDYNQFGLENPKIILDNGDIVWGCQCWWGSEKAIRDTLEKCDKDKIVNVRINEELG